MKRLITFIFLLGTLLLIVPATVSANAATQFAATSQSSHVALMGCGNGTTGNYNVTATVTNGKFVGNKTWGAGGGRGDITFFIDINGKLSSSAGKTTLRVTYTYCGANYDKEVAAASAGQTVTVIKNPFVENTNIGGYSNVKLYVCNDSPTYHCGSEV